MSEISKREAVENTEERSRKVCTTKEMCTKLTLAFEKPIEHVLKSWSMSQAGIGHLSTCYHKPPKPSQQHTHKFVPVHPKPEKSLVRPHTQLKLIFSVILLHPSLNGLIEKAVKNDAGKN